MVRFLSGGVREYWDFFSATIRAHLGNTRREVETSPTVALRWWEIETSPAVLIYRIRLRDFVPFSFASGQAGQAGQAGRTGRTVGGQDSVDNSLMMYNRFRFRSSMAVFMETPFVLSFWGKLLI